MHRFEQLWRTRSPLDRARGGYLIECSSGTYVRSLIADLGDAYCVELRRTAIGPFVRRGRARRPAWRRDVEHSRAAHRRSATPKARVATAFDRAAAAAAAPRSTAHARPAAPRSRRASAPRRGLRRADARVDATLRLPARGGHAPARCRAPAAARVAVGTFDGVHLGHREVIAGADSVLTFDPHPVVGGRARSTRRSC